MIKDSSSGYGLITIVLHWISALMTIFLFGLGYYMVGVGYYDPWYHRGPALHISVGLTLLVLTVVRSLWRLVNPKPAPLASYSRPCRWSRSLKKQPLCCFISDLS